MNTLTISLVAIFSALNFAIAAINRFVPGGFLGGVSIAHVTLDAVLCTCFLITLMRLVNRFGAASLVGLITGLLMLTLGAKSIAPLTWLIRGLVLDIVIFGVLRHKGNSISTYSVAAFLAFFSQTFVGKVLVILLFSPMDAWLLLTKTIFIPMTLAGSTISTMGAYIALRRLTPLLERRFLKVVV